MSRRIAPAVARSRAGWAARATKAPPCSRDGSASRRQRARVTVREAKIATMRTRRRAHRLYLPLPGQSTRARAGVLRNIIEDER